MTVHLTLYAVRNRHGKYMAKANRAGLSWVADLKDARLYSKPGPARSQVTWYANHELKGGIPDLVELRVTEVVALNELNRVQKSMNRKATAEEKRRRDEVRHLRRSAEIKLQEAKDMLARLDRDQPDVDSNNGGGWK